METNIQTAEPVIITGLNTGQEDFDYSMVELAELAQANHMEVIDRIDKSSIVLILLPTLEKAK